MGKRIIIQMKNQMEEYLETLKTISHKIDDKAKNE